MLNIKNIECPFCKKKELFINECNVGYYESYYECKNCGSTFVSWKLNSILDLANK